jgi:phenylalanyl-tRNA synthetase alpha chain
MTPNLRRSHQFSNSPMQDILAKIDELRARSLAELAQVSSPADLEKWRIRYLGTNGEVRNATDLIKLAQGPDKKAIGQRVNTMKNEVNQAFEHKKATLSSDAPADKDHIDITEPGQKPQIGRTHVITQVTNELTELFGRMGFTVAAGPEVEDEFHNFIALNIPPSHPARDPLDNFYLTPSGLDSGLRAQDSGLLLRTQTSTVQIRVMERQPPPIRVVIPGKVYRPDTMDATHLPMFHQLEALVVDKDVTMVDLKSTVLQFVHAYFGADTKVRFRPSFFPFTEPSAEVDVWFPDKNRWIELGGCGMVHPNVLKVLEKHGLDSTQYSGWAFGFGIDRIAMRKYAIPDIRMLVENDLRFLQQF